MTMALKPVLKVGSQGKEVLELKKLLSQAGHDVSAGPSFDEKTSAAVIAFQKSCGLIPDGIVGKKTWGALGAGTQGISEGSAPGLASASAPGASKGFEFSTVLKMCPHAPVENIKKNFPGIIQALDARKLCNEAMIRMAVATTYVETGVFAPISELKSQYNTSGKSHPFDLYDYRKDLGNKGPPDGGNFKGRGYIQLTGRANYEKFGKILGVDLVADPELANTPKIAAGVLAEFLKSHEAVIMKALTENDLARARKCINGGSYGLSQFIQSYTAGMDSAAKAA